MKSFVLVFGLLLFTLAGSSAALADEAFSCQDAESHTFKISEVKEDEWNLAVLDMGAYDGVRKFYGTHEFFCSQSPERLEAANQLWTCRSSVTGPSLFSLKVEKNQTTGSIAVRVFLSGMYLGRPSVAAELNCQ